MENIMRPSGRAFDALRDIDFEIGYAPHAEGSCFVKCGNTHVLCTASIEERVPPFLKGTGAGWVTAEYGMLPRSTGSRMNREAAKGKQSGRTQEIQRLIGRSLRAATDLKGLGEKQIIIEDNFVLSSYLDISNIIQKELIISPYSLFPYSNRKFIFHTT